MGHPEDEAIRPWFYTWSLMSRLFPKGSRIAAAQETNIPAGVRTIAAVDAHRLSVMLVNDSAEPRTIEVRIPGSPAKKLLRYDYFAENRPVNREGFPLPQKRKLKSDATGAVRVELPSQGVVFLVRDNP
jgi:hypothetical protein